MELEQSRVCIFTKTGQKYYSDMQPLFVSAFNFHTTLHAAVTWKVSRYDVLVYMHATSELSSSAIFLLTCSQNSKLGGGAGQPISRAEIFI